MPTNSEFDTGEFGTQEFNNSTDPPTPSTGRNLFCASFNAALSGAGIVGGVT